MRFQMAHDRDEHELGARVEDVAQDSVEATALAYTDDAGIDVADRLRTELHSRGLEADEQTIADLAHAIRSGHDVSVRPDGTVSEPPPG
jgi:hypothetical protein